MRDGEPMLWKALLRVEYGFDIRLGVGSVYVREPHAFSLVDHLDKGGERPGEQEILEKDRDESRSSPRRQAFAKINGKLGANAIGQNLAAEYGP